MRTILPVIFLLFNLQASAQYTGFVHSDKKIKWNVEHNTILEITPLNKKLGIKQIMFEKIEKNKPIQLFVDSQDILHQIAYYEIPGLEKKYYNSMESPYKKRLNYANVDKESAFIAKEKQCDCNSTKGNNSFDIYRIKQILYYKNSSLQVRNVWVTPLCLNKVTGTSRISTFTWESTVSSFLHTGKAKSSFKKPKLVHAGNAEAVYNFRQNIKDSTAIKIQALRSSYSSELIKDILAGKVTITDEENKILPATNVFEWDKLPMENPGTAEPAFKSLQIQHAVKNLDSLYEFSINQEFYIDTVLNRLYAEVNYINVLKRIVTSGGIELGTALVYRVYFMKPSAYRKMETKKTKALQS